MFPPTPDSSGSTPTDRSFASRYATRSASPDGYRRTRQGFFLPGLFVGEKGVASLVFFTFYPVFFFFFFQNPRPVHFIKSSVSGDHPCLVATAD